MIKKIILSALIGTSVFAAHQAEFNFNDKEVEGQLLFDLSKMGVPLGGAYAGARILNGDERNSDKIENISQFKEVSFLIMRPMESVAGLSLGLGIKGVYTKFDGAHYAAIPLGLEANMKLPFATLFPLHLNGALYYAPSDLTFLDGDKYLEVRTYLDAEVIHNRHIEVGYRNIDPDLISHPFSSHNVTYNEAFYAGLRLDF
ncbi:MAG: YfaZ family outer membrane protein [Sulfuricurvum sp.]|uniref:YfaZ family outer membrane protein n=1 Tax=Sulfuricurvum sp. TaxID=2025608 RepID=UPI0026038C81|nr:YfaZ family outer membrane protein [Sulfuricurvum sp.]MDD2368651.1 YfaZ family outer membrane protein [Sulfuricurvum sp.]MDD2950813.1 YfaZ family outer membrane protein [Sulfuricurvum sp.]MDD5117960.1 YfaZ family outer membrane protein [Sulfuricurvum sp.]